MSRKLGSQTSNRTEFSTGEVQTPEFCADCPKLRLLLNSTAGLRQEKNDEYLTDSDVNIMALRSCARINMLLREQDRGCRLSGFELPEDSVLS